MQFAPRPRLRSLGGGSRTASRAVRKLAEAAGALVISSPGASGVLPSNHPQNMCVGGSKGSISGNWAMNEAELLIVIGSRAVCQADCSGIGWPKARHVVNINADPIDVQHYNNTIALTGDASIVADRLAEMLGAHGPDPGKAAWLEAGRAKRAEWDNFLARQASSPPLFDPVWQKPVLTQPRVIRVAADFCRRHGSLKFFDAGDVQANGFQIVEDQAPFETFTETGASYMGFAVSALLAAGIADNGRHGIAFTGDGSFMMNPQVLIDGVEHGVHGTILLLDNRRMAAISHLQHSQYGREFRTNDGVAVDYVRLAAAVSGVRALSGGEDEESLVAALEEAHAWSGLSLIHVPVYFGEDPAVGLGAYGQWNVGNWVDDVQRQYARTLI